MPPRPPPQPSTLTILCSAAALVAVWLSLGIDQLARGGAGTAVGVPIRSIVVSSSSLFIPTVVQGPSGGLGAGAYAFMVLAGPVGILVAAGALQAIANVLWSRGWLRGFALVWFVVALLWVPTAFAAGALVHGGGPIHELYGRLGAPLAGRWSALALAVVLLAGTARLASIQAVQVGRSWMRADAREFRRRLVRVTAGWPGIAAILALALGAGWAPTPWVVIYLTMVMMSLQISTL
ncbi:MAG TPA: hypothetical protein VGI92_10650 [Gemmatimonadales bacterium]|jgi:hypothetical protein